MRLSLYARFLIALAMLAACSFSTPAQTPPRDDRPRNRSITGRVTIGGNPAFNKTVMVAELRGQDGGGIVINNGALAGDAIVHSLKTDADGRYRAANLRAGNYEVRVQADAYVSEKKSDRRQRVVALDDGEAAENVDFALVRGGVITGRVTDAAGHPLIAQRLQVHLVQEDGQREQHHDYPNHEALETDDRGIYRLYGLRAGRYRLSAGGAGYSPFGAAANKYPVTYYPDTTDEKQAKIIEVKEGGEVAEVDIRLGAKKATYTVAGRVLEVETNQPLAQVTLMCFGRGGQDAAMASFNGTTTTDVKGNFRLDGLPAGQYSIQLSPDLGFLGQTEHYTEPAKFEIKDADLSGVEVQAKRGATISGAVIVAANQDAQNKVNLAQLMISTEITRKPTGQSGTDEPAQDFSASGFTAAKINSDGSFRITGLPPGNVRFELVNISGHAPKITRVERNGVESPAIEVKAGEAVTGVRLILAYAKGAIRGQVNITGGQLPDGWKIIAFANRRDDPGNHDGGHAEVDGKGRFAMEGLLDGEYELMVVAHMNNRPTNQAPPSVRQRVRITNGGEMQVNVTLDLSKKEQE